MKTTKIFQTKIETKENTQIFTSTIETIEVDEFMLMEKIVSPIHSNILIIEDDIVSSLIIKELFLKKSIPYSIVSNEIDALKEIKHKHYNLIFLGINDPDTYVDLLAYLFNTETKYKTKLIVLTCNLTKNYINIDLQLKFNQILLKPEYISELNKILFIYRKNNPKIETQTHELSPDSKHTFDLDQLKSISNNNKDFISKMLGKFVLSAIECSETLSKANSEGDYEIIMKAAHKAIPSYAILRLNDLVKYLLYLEANAHSATEKNEIQKNVLLFIHENKRLIAEIKNYLKH